MLILIKIQLISELYSKQRQEAACLWLFLYSIHYPLESSHFAMAQSIGCQYLQEQFKIQS